MMKPVLCSFLLVAVVVSYLVQSAPTQKKPIKDSELKVIYEANNYKPDEFDWSYELSDGREVRSNAFWTQTENGTRYLQANGLYSYIAPDGVRYTVSWYSSETGYHATLIIGDHPLYPEGFQDIDPKVLGSLVG